jgi:hypothetical protein
LPSCLLRDHRRHDRLHPQHLHSRLRQRRLFLARETEERHLSLDPAYRDYAEWMARHGPIPRLLRTLSSPFRRPRPDAVPAE